MPRLFIIITLFFPAMLFALTEAHPEKDLVELINEYINVIVAGDWDNARSFWNDDDLKKSERMGIVFTDCPAKYDCASALLINWKYLKSGSAHAAVGNIDIKNGYAIISVLVQNGTDTVSTDYYAMPGKEGWELVSPMRALCRDWKLYKTEYVNVYCRDSSLINLCDLSHPDITIEYMGDFLEISPKRMSELSKKRLDYYVCTADDFKRLTGHDAQGITNLQFDAVITRRFPHLHELSHFLMNYTLKELPLYTLPILQEGWAVAMGGRFDKSLCVAISLGQALLENNVCTVHELLTWQGFNETVAMPDLSYPVSAVFVRYLLWELGMEKFKRLYRDCSGSDSAVRAITAEDFKSSAEKYSSLSWDELMTEFEYYWKNADFSGIHAGFPDFDYDPVRVLRGKNCLLEIWEDSLDYYFKASNIDSDDKVTLLMDVADECRSDNYQSMLFKEHMPDSVYHGTIFAIRFDTQEAGFYDYFANRLEAKFISSFEPETDYWNADDGTLKFRLKKHFVSNMLSGYDFEIIEE